MPLHRIPNLQSRLSCLLTLLFMCGQVPRAEILISEVLKNPAGRESDMGGGLSHEFVEIVNTGPDSLRLDSLFLTDGETVDSVIPWSAPLPANPNCRLNRRFIEPGGTALILDRDYGVASVTNPFRIADSTILLTTPKTSIAGGLTEDKGLILFKGTASTIRDSLAGALDPGQEAALGKRLVHATPVGTPEGFSLEPDALLFPSIEWQPSPDSLSPGAWPRLKMGWLAEYRLHAQASQPTILCSLGVFSPAVTYARTWKIARTGSGTIVTSGALVTGTIPSFVTVSLPADTVAYQFVLSEGSDQKEWDIDISTIVTPPAPIRINEIFPRATTECPEWIELVNVSSMPINLKNWRLAVGDAITTLTSSDCIINPQSFCLVTNDRNMLINRYILRSVIINVEKWQYLDNYRDTLKLLNSVANKPTETVFYSSSWFQSFENQSIERVSTIDSNALEARDWVLAENPSPGQPNTSTTWRATATASIHIGPIPFSPNGDGKDDLLLISLMLPAGAAATISIYGFDGRRLRIYSNVTAPRLFWDGRTDDGAVAPVGPLYVVAEISANGKKSLIRHKGILWR